VQEIFPIAPEPVGLALQPVARGPSSGQTMDPNTVDDHGMVFVRTYFRRTRKPPFRPLLKQSFSTGAGRSVGRRITHLFISPESEDRRPVIPVGDVLDLYANLGVFSHPRDLLADGRKGIETSSYRIKGEMDGDDVGLVVVGASQPTQIGSL
jgi:hypothetical protein